MTDDALPFLGVDQLQQFPHLQKWLGPSFAGTVELGHIVESPVIRAATSVVPLGWKGIPGAKNGEPLKVDITGFGLHLCTLVQARVNGNWYCSSILLVIRHCCCRHLLLLFSVLAFCFSFYWLSLVRCCYLSIYAIY